MFSKLALNAFCLLIEHKIKYDYILAQNLQNFASTLILKHFLVVLYAVGTHH